ncbi:uncharacterized protein LOC143231464 [Tachypleus tridentatus]|uniref:uncharacterized protein LOC143231464 n=1 Tax=Tachypleus tridentatus TaxID=6853 RepID=UPI003FD36FF0
MVKLCPIFNLNLKWSLMALMMTITVAYPSGDDETQLVLESVGQLFRQLFPMIPTKTQYVWKITHQDFPLKNTNTYYDELDNDDPVLSNDVQPWSLESEFRKRGPDCMKKCIAQGILHPVQCHSLC